MAGYSRSDKEMRELASSTAMREEMRRVCVRERLLTTDDWLEFLEAYNDFISHKPRPLRPIVGERWRL
jgi:hypothetical protein